VDGALDELRTGLERQLLLDAFPVGFNRLDAQMKAFCDPASAPALADQAKDFELAVGEHGQGRVLFERSASEKFLGDAKKVRLDLGAKAEKRTITLENDSRRLTSERRRRARRLPPA